MTTASTIIPFFVILPLAAAFLVSLFGKKSDTACDVLAVVASVILGGLSLLSVRLAGVHGTLAYSLGSWVPPIGIVMVLDGLTAFMLVTVNVVAFAIAIYSISYMEKFTAKWKPRLYEELEP